MKIRHLLFLLSLLFFGFRELSLTQAPEFTWAKVFHGGVSKAPKNGLYMYGTRCVTDQCGNIYLSAYTADSIMTFDDSTYHFPWAPSPNFNLNRYLVRMRSDGMLVWVIKSDMGYATTMSIKKNGNVVISDGTVSAEYDSSGNLVGSKQIPVYTRVSKTRNDGNTHINPTAAKKTPLMTVIDDGINHFEFQLVPSSDTVQLGTITLLPLPADSITIWSFCIAKYDSEGNVIWAHRYKGLSGLPDEYTFVSNLRGEQFLRILARTPTVSVGSFFYKAPNGKYLNSMVKFNEDGEPQWMVTGIDGLITPDPYGNLFLWDDTGIARYDEYGGKDWSTTFSPYQHSPLVGTSIVGVTTDYVGNCYVFGYISQRGDFGNFSFIDDKPSLDPNLWQSPFIAKLSSNITPLTSGTKFRTFNQSDFAATAVKIPKKGKRPMPNAGNARDEAMDKIVTKMKQDIVLGVVRKDSAKAYGWIRFSGKGAVAKSYLLQTGTPRGFDVLGKKAFLGELKNPAAKKYQNKLAGELAVLKLNIAASRAFVTNYGLGNVVFFDSTQPEHIFNGKTYKQIAKYVDTTLTYYKRFYTGATIPPMYATMAATLESLNVAFRGTIDTVSTLPLALTGVKPIAEVAYLRPPTGKEITVNDTPVFTEQEPVERTLLTAYPSPFNPTTTIKFELGKAGFVTLKVYNTIGQEVATLLHNEYQDAGVNVVEFNAGNLPSGVYFVHLENVSKDGSSMMKTNKIVLVR